MRHELHGIFNSFELQTQFTASNDDFFLLLLLLYISQAELPEFDNPYSL